MGLFVTHPRPCLTFAPIVTSRHMFDISKAQLATATEKLAHLRRFL
jgi:hypothetical protein